MAITSKMIRSKWCNNMLINKHTMFEGIPFLNAPEELQHTNFCDRQMNRTKTTCLPQKGGGIISRGECNLFLLHMW
jgi:hypothetical protein